MAASRRLGTRTGAPTGPYLASQYVKQRTALIWGVANRSMLRDEAKCFLDAGGLIEVSDMVLRMLRIALPPGDQAPADGHALILLQAVGGFHAYLRAVTAPPNAQPVARFLLFERAYPDSVAACVDSLHDVFTTADAGPRNSKPVLRVSRLAADLDFQRRALPDGAELDRHLRAHPAGARPHRPGRRRALLRGRHRGTRKGESCTSRSAT